MSLGFFLFRMTQFTKKAKKKFWKNVEKFLSLEETQSAPGGEGGHVDYFKTLPMW